MTEDFFKKHIEAFLSEALIHINNMNTTLLNLEKTPDDPKLLHHIFQAAHTLKSMAATMRYDQFAELCHAIEDLFDALRAKTCNLASCSDLLFECLDFLSASLKSISENQSEYDSQELVQCIRQFLLDGKKPLETIHKTQKPLLFETEKIRVIEVKVERLDTLMNLSEELLVSRLKLELLRESINDPELTATIDTLGPIVTEMQYNIMQVRLVPIGVIFNRFARMCRDLAKLENKIVELQMEGEDIELDRSMIDEIGESITHLVRNAIDHGLETPELRKKANKNPQGTIRLVAKSSKEFVIIEISDDGNGIDFEAIKSAAQKQGILPDSPTKEALIELIFQDISTTKEVTLVSGRGLGLAIVKQKIESIGGKIHVESTQGIGTLFRIEIPLSLAIIKVLFVKVSEHIYGIPMSNIERLVTIPQADFKGLLNYETIIYDDENIPITHLSTLFGQPRKLVAQYPIVIIQRGEEKLGIAVESLLSTQEVVIKPLGRAIKENKYFSGSALVGSGEMILILDVANLLLSKNGEKLHATGSTQ